MLFFILIIISSSETISARFQCPNPHSPYLSIELPVVWNHGSRNCFEKFSRQSTIDMFRVNNDTYILRENKCLNYEGTFMYLLFSQNFIFLIDSGATISSKLFPIQQLVENLIYQWCMKNKRDRKQMQLIVSHTHNHDDHTAGDRQFQNKSRTTILGTQLDDIIRFFRISNWPYSISTYKLDSQRHLAIIPIPGHEQSSLAFYDCATGFLLTGDSFYPGRLYISNFSAYVESISRLIDFIYSNHLNITAILGSHIEMTKISHMDYPIGATYQPNERSLFMSVKDLEELHRELQSQMKNDFHLRHKVYFDKFILDPNPSELPLLQANERFSIHRFVLMPLDRLEYVWLSYQPQFLTSIDYQFVFLATITNRTNHLLLSSINLTKFYHHWTIESYEFSLNNLLNGNLSIFQAKLYLGNYEQYLDDIFLNPIRTYLTINQLNLTQIEPYQPLRYYSYLSSKSTKTQIQLYFLHQIRILPDFDAIVHGIINPMNCTTDRTRKDLNNLLEFNGNQWAFHGLENNVFHRLTSASGQIRAQLLGDIYSTICTIQIIQEFQCTFFSHYQTHSNESFHYQSNSCPRITTMNHHHHYEEKFFHGFLPVWPLTLFAIALVFVLIFIAGIICHFVGCRRTRNETINTNLIQMVERPLIIENKSNQLTQMFNDDQF